MDNFNYGGGGAAFPGQQPVGGGAFGASHDNNNNMGDDPNLRPSALPALSFLGANYGGGFSQQSSSAARSLDGPTSGYQLPSFGMNNGLNGNGNGALQYIAPGSDRPAQAHTSLNNSGGYGGFQFNSRLIGMGNQIDGQNERSGNRHRFNDNITETFAETETTMASAACATSANDNGTMNMAHMAKVPLGTNIRISDTRETNTNGRSLCKVVGCNKLDQSQNDGFCRTHFNMVSTPAIFRNNMGDSWNCVCGNIVSAKKKRCGQCNKWRGGKRDPYSSGPKKAGAHKKAAASKSKKPRVSDVKIGHDNNGNWTCTCGNEVSSTKARCGKCHHWRGGKRKGGWKIKSFGKSGEDDDIDWTQDWSCCDMVIPAKKKRCGNCHGWRGGRRIASTKAPSKVEEMYPILKDESAITKESGTDEGNGDKSKYYVTEFL
eukprot:CAMPEP_0181127588 /NCGR_PEP_ID=MMETSP1071-20121207/28282_1 /TAXON_ID=35127 /ORGANISM="Thalassiosira sp., Strain NH16" /LENGTH=431 /DNA_ID=CAMNT_0023213345 /DNA_START=76 /DNA_END=1371 /DNA_ORIENTATION=+